MVIVTATMIATMTIFQRAFKTHSQCPYRHSSPMVFSEVSYEDKGWGRPDLLLNLLARILIRGFRENAPNPFPFVFSETRAPEESDINVEFNLIGEKHGRWLTS
jgi:hypothetical protein